MTITVTHTKVVTSPDNPAFDVSTSEWNDAHGITGTLNHTVDLTNVGTNTHAQIDTHITDATVHLTTAQNTLLDALSATAAELNYSVGVTSAIQTQLDGKGYFLHVQALTSSPADAQTVYFGQLPKAPVTTSAGSKVYIRKAGTIKITQIYSFSGTAGTNEAWSLYIRVNDTTDTLIQTVSSATTERIWTNSTLSIAMAAGDYFEIKMVNPTWATNPLTSIFGGYIYLE